MTTQEQKDAVTVGQIRAIMSDRLEGQIDTLAKLIRQGYHKRHEAEEYLQKTIGQTLTEMDNLNSFAGLPSLRAILSK